MQVYKFLEEGQNFYFFCDLGCDRVSSTRPGLPGNGYRCYESPVPQYRNLYCCLDNAIVRPSMDWVVEIPKCSEVKKGLLMGPRGLTGPKELTGLTGLTKQMEPMGQMGPMGPMGPNGVIPLKNGTTIDFGLK